MIQGTYISMGHANTCFKDFIIENIY